VLILKIIENTEVNLWQNSEFLLSTVGEKCSYHCILTNYMKMKVRAENKIFVIKINTI